VIESTNSILTADRGRTQSAALWVLCVLAGMQVLLLGALFWQRSAGVAAAPKGGTAVLELADGFASPESNGAVGSNAAPGSTPLAAAGPLSPPLPGQLAGETQAAVDFSGSGSGIAVPAPGMLATDAVGGNVVVSAGPAAMQVSAPQMDEEMKNLLEMVEQMRQAGDTASLLELLKAAEGMDAGHPELLRAFAVTYDQMGLNDKAMEYWMRLEAQGPTVAGALYALAQQRLQALRLGDAGGYDVVGDVDASTLPGQPVAPSQPAFSRVSDGAVLRVGLCEVARDELVVEGEKRLLRIPIQRLGDTDIEPSAVTVDVFFFDRVNGERVEATRADPPQANWASGPIDWKSDPVEVLDVVYHLPKMSELEVRNHGVRTYHGYVIKLYYQDRLQAVVAEPAELMGLGDSMGGREG
jgi:hypothetical protein